MKIWYISKYAVSPKYNNAYRQYYLSKYFAREGHKTSLISSRSAALYAPCAIRGLFKREVDGNLEHIILNGPTIRYGFSVRRVISWIVFEFNLLLYCLGVRKNDRPDVMIVSSLSILTFVTGVFLRFLFRCKLIVEIRDVYPRTLVEVGGFSTYNPLVIVLGWIEKLGYRYADGIVSSLPNFRSHLLSVMPSAERKPYRYIPMGIDDDLLSDSSETGSFAGVDGRPGTFVVGYAGTVGIANSVETIVDAARVLSKRKLPILFYILGDGTQLETMKIRAADLDNIVFLGKIPKQRVPGFLEKCDLLVNPWRRLAIYELGVSPNKWIDYMRAAKPIIVAYSGYRCIVDEAGCGAFVDAEDPQALADEIARWASLPAETVKESGARGRAYLESHLRYSSLAQSYLALMEELECTR